MTPIQSLLTQSAATVTLSLRAVFKLQFKSISQDPGLWTTIFKEQKIRMLLAVKINILYEIFVSVLNM